MVEKSAFSVKISFEFNLPMDITLVNLKKLSDCPMLFIYHFIYDDMYRSLSSEPGTWRDNQYLDKEFLISYLKSSGKSEYSDLTFKLQENADFI